VTDDLVPIFVRLGRYDEVIDHQRKVLRQLTDPNPTADPVGQRGSLINLVQRLRYDPQLDPMRSDPQFQQLLKDAGAAAVSIAPAAGRLRPSTQNPSC